MENTEITILHREKGFVVCIKPSGVLSENSDRATDGMVDLLSEALSTQVFPIHRLDREASGVMLYALNKTAAAKFSALVSDGGLEKKYKIVVHGVPSENEGIMEDLLFKDSKKNKSFVVKRERKGVKRAKLEYRLCETKSIDGEDFSLIDVKLHTGRTHQIRVQFSSRGMPVCGDTRYGSPRRDEMCLFSSSLCFTNPFNGEKCEFSAEPCVGMFKKFIE